MLLTYRNIYSVGNVRNRETNFDCFERAKMITSSFKTKWWCLAVILVFQEVLLEIRCHGQDDYDDYEYSEDYFDRDIHRKNYNGKYVGKLNSYHHQVNGQIYAVNEKTLLLKNFQYDGQGRDAFFYAGGTGRPGPSGFIVPNEYYRSNVLER